MNDARHKIRKMLDEEHTNCEYEESLIDKIDNMLTESFSAGYSFAKNEDELVRKASESLSE